MTHTVPVPVEPTEEMLDAAGAQYGVEDPSYRPDLIWAAMLAAAPKPSIPKNASDALKQILAVCADNAGEHFRHDFALKFIQEIATKHTASPPSIPEDDREAYARAHYAQYHHRLPWDAAYQIDRDRAFATADFAIQTLISLGWSKQK